MTACSNQASQESFKTQQPSASPEIVVFTSTSKVIINTPTHALTVTSSPQPLSTQTPTPIDLDSLPNLTDVILSSSDVESIDKYGSNPLILIADTTHELKDSCLWDCAKFRYSLEHGTLTIMLLRAGNHQKAESTAQNLRNDFLPMAKTTMGGAEYTLDDIPSMPPESWVIVDAPSSTKDIRTSAAGMSYGSIVILVTYSQSFCEYMPNYGRYCEGDMMGLALSSVEYIMAQIQKLEASGYPK
jgi:hypothetical protein